MNACYDQRLKDVSGLIHHCRLLNFKEKHQNTNHWADAHSILIWIGSCNDVSIDCNDSFCCLQHQTLVRSKHNRVLQPHCAPHTWWHLLISIDWCIFLLAVPLSSISPCFDAGDAMATSWILEQHLLVIYHSIRHTKYGIPDGEMLILTLWVFSKSSTCQVDQHLTQGNLFSEQSLFEE